MGSHSRPIETPRTASEADAHERGIEPMDERDVLEHLGTLSDRLADAVETRVTIYRGADFGYV